MAKLSSNDFLRDLTSRLPPQPPDRNELIEKAVDEAARQISYEGQYTSAQKEVLSKLVTRIMEIVEETK